jgi:hypothetical protein
MECSHSKLLPGSTGSYLTSEDRAFLRSLANMLASQGAFFLARLRQANDLEEFARKVTVWREGRFWSIGELLEHCTRHNWNAQIYEAWAYETAARVRQIAREIAGDAGDALLLCATAQGLMEVSYNDMMEAVSEAHELLYGEETPRCED